MSKEHKKKMAMIIKSRMSFQNVLIASKTSLGVSTRYFPILVSVEGCTCLKRKHVKAVWTWRKMPFYFRPGSPAKKCSVFRSTLYICQASL